MRVLENLDIDEGYLLETLVPNDLRYVRKIRYLLLKAHENLDNEDLKKYKSNNDLIASFKRSAPEILRTHPLTEKRIKNLEVLLESTKEICK